MKLRSYVPWCLLRELLVSIDADVAPSIIDNRLWRDEKRSLPVGRNRFKAKLGWNGTV